MTQPLLDHLRMLPAGQQHRGAPVAQNVEANRGDARSFDQPGEGPDSRVRVNRRADGRVEDEIATALAGFLREAGC